MQIVRILWRACFIGAIWCQQDVQFANKTSLDFAVDARYLVENRAVCAWNFRCVIYGEHQDLSLVMLKGFQVITHMNSFHRKWPIRALNNYCWLSDDLMWFCKNNCGRDISAHLRGTLNSVSVHIPLLDFTLLIFGSELFSIKNTTWISRQWQQRIQVCTAMVLFQEKRWHRCHRRS